MDPADQVLLRLADPAARPTLLDADALLQLAITCYAVDPAAVTGPTTAVYDRFDLAVALPVETSLSARLMRAGRRSARHPGGALSRDRRSALLRAPRSGTPSLIYAASTQPADDLAFERIINVPKRGLGDATTQLLHNHARAARVPMMEAARYLVETDELKPKPSFDPARSPDLVRTLVEALRNDDAVRRRQTVLEESGYTDMWQRDNRRTLRGA